MVRASVRKKNLAIFGNCNIHKACGVGIMGIGIFNDLNIWYTFLFYE
jgi:hypothetical protein